MKNIYFYMYENTTEAFILLTYVKIMFYSR